VSDPCRVFVCVEQSISHLCFFLSLSGYFHALWLVFIQARRSHSILRTRQYFAQETTKQSVGQRLRGQNWSTYTVYSDEATASVYVTYTCATQGCVLLRRSLALRRHKADGFECQFSRGAHRQTNEAPPIPVSRSLANH